MNVHIHTSELTLASRVLRSIGAAGASGCFGNRFYVGAGNPSQGTRTDVNGQIAYQILSRRPLVGAGLLRKLYATALWSTKAKNLILKIRPTCINCHGISTLGLAVNLKRKLGCRLIYDTHELEALSAASRGLRRIFTKPLEMALIKYCDAVVCVTDSISDWYTKQYRIPRPAVVRNIPDARPSVNNIEFPGGERYLRNRFGIAENGIIFLYLGVLAPGRRIPQILKYFEQTSADRHIIFVGNGPLEGMVQDVSERVKNIHFHPAVKPNETISIARGADVGLQGGENICLSYYYSLPNKFFEYLHAGIPVLANDWPELRKIIATHNCGWIVEDADQAWIDRISKLTKNEISAAKVAAQGAAGHYSWKEEEIRMAEVYRKVLTGQH